MAIKDWVLLIVPIICNGVIVFFLQRYYEKKQRVRTLINNYITVIINKIDTSLEAHAKATRLANENNETNGVEINNVLQQFFNNTLDVYYYYVQNKNIFKPLENELEQLGGLVLDFSQYVNGVDKTAEQISSKVNNIRDVLIKIKDKCIHLASI